MIPEGLFATENGKRLLEFLCTTANAANTIADATRHEAHIADSKPSNSEAAIAEERTARLNILKTAADTTSALADIARTLVAKPDPELSEHQGAQAGLNPTTPPAGGPAHKLEVVIPDFSSGCRRNVGEGPFIIDEIVGVISLAAWQNMGEKTGRKLDETLRNIVRKVSGGDKTWDAITSIIQEDLAGFGLRFTTEGSLPENPLNSWTRDGLSDTARIDIMEDRARLRDTHWYTYAMVRILRRLMVLRGFHSIDIV